MSEINEIYGDLLDSKAQVIIHQCNCCNGFGSGVAKAIKAKYPIVAEKHKLAVDTNIEKGNVTANLLGKIQPVRVSDSQVIINMFSQDKFGSDGKRYTSYDALDDCLDKVIKYCNDNKLTSVALPYKMSSVRGGANWIVVLTMIVQKFKDTNINIDIMRLEDENSK